MMSGAGDEPLPLQPRPQDYTDSKEYARDLGEWLVRYIEKRNAHRSASIKMVADETALNSIDLTRGMARPGWVHTEIEGLKEDNRALLEDNKSLRRRQTWLLVTAALALVSLVTTLTAFIIQTGAPT